jgi:hypothetical protein
VNGGALITGAVAAGGGYAWLRVLQREIGARAAGEMPDNDEELEYEGPFRFFSTGYLKIQRAVAYAIVAVGLSLVALALFS